MLMDRTALVFNAHGGFMVSLSSITACGRYKFRLSIFLGELLKIASLLAVYLFSHEYTILLKKYAIQLR